MTLDSVDRNGYILYRNRDFSRAQEWFEKASVDDRFTDIASYYILECRFMLKDHRYVTANGDAMYDAVPESRRPHLARIISESWLVLGDADKARKYYDLGIGDGNGPDSRTDWFYSGSVLYAVDDYEGAIRSSALSATAGAAITSPGSIASEASPVFIVAIFIFRSCCCVPEITAPLRRLRRYEYE